MMLMVAMWVAVEEECCLAWSQGGEDGKRKGIYIFSC
jgi:hypothetical protein